MTAPYYEDDLVSIFHGDSMEILPTLRAASTALVVTDPPYVIGAVSAGNIGAKSGGWFDMMNSALWFQAWYQHVDRVLHSTGSFWSFCNWRSLPVVMRAAIDAGLPLTSVMVWDKMWIGPGGPIGLRPGYEMCALMAQPQFAIEDRGLSDVWQEKVGSYKPHGHPAEKPERLIRRIIDICNVPEGGVVLDPFLGSGTTAAAAKSLGLRCIGIEAEEKWCEVAATRCAQQSFDFGAAS